MTGGYVYRGVATPALSGAYVFADYVTRGVFTWRKGDPQPTKPLMTSPGSVASFGEDEDGELYLLELETGKIRRFEQGLGAPVVPPPARLSQTGCFADLASLTPAAGILSYEPRWPFWSDGADKRRWVVLPDGGKVVPTPPSEGPWRFPVGTVYIKHFEIALANGATRRLETRFLIQEDPGVRGFTYRWDESGSDAVLLADAARAPIVTPEASFDWYFPSPSDCTTCHRGTGVLGLDGYQLANEPRDWERLGLLTVRAPSATLHPRPDSAAPPVDKARAWLDVNCAYCHDGGGPSGTPLDLRRDTPLVSMEACDKAPIRGPGGVTPESSARLIAPGDAQRSVLHERALRRDAQMMPPLATALPDPSLAHVRSWIDSLSGCP